MLTVGLAKKRKDEAAEAVPEYVVVNMAVAVS